MTHQLSLERSLNGQKRTRRFGQRQDVGFTAFDMTVGFIFDKILNAQSCCQVRRNRRWKDVISCGGMQFISRVSETVRCLGI